MTRPVEGPGLAVVPGSVLREIGEVVRALPRSGAEPVEVARWYRRKAQLLEHIAAEAGTAPAGTLEMARKARRRAAELASTGAAVVGGS